MTIHYHHAGGAAASADDASVTPTARDMLALSLIPRLGAVGIARMRESGIHWPEGWRQLLSASQRHYFDYLRQPLGQSKVIAPMMQWCDEEGKRVLLHAGHRDWPALLSQLPDPPPVLWARGSLACLRGPSLAIVGTRRPTRAGRHHARTFSHSIAERGGTVVSGMALGIDAAAHEGALEAGGKTIAVLGCGLSHVYPHQHAGLQARILEAGGLLLSEHPPETQARPAFFPRRNRIITGMSLGVLVVEAMARSGSLVSARLALEQNRDVFAVPGPISTATSEGCHQLIRQGAALVTTPEELLEEIEVAWPQVQSVFRGAKPVCPRTSMQTDRWLKLLLDGPLSVDELVLRSGDTVSGVMNAMLAHELTGRVALSGDGWALSPRSSESGVQTR